MAAAGAPQLVLSCNGSVLAIAASIVGFLAVGYAVALGLTFCVDGRRTASREISDVMRRIWQCYDDTVRLKDKLMALAPHLLTASPQRRQLRAAFKRAWGPMKEASAVWRSFRDQQDTPNSNTYTLGWTSMGRDPQGAGKAGSGACGAAGGCGRGSCRAVETTTINAHRVTDRQRQFSIRQIHTRHRAAFPTIPRKRPHTKQSHSRHHFRRSHSHASRGTNLTLAYPHGSALSTLYIPHHLQSCASATPDTTHPSTPSNSTPPVPNPAFEATLAAPHTSPLVPETALQRGHRAYQCGRRQRGRIRLRAGGLSGDVAWQGEASGLEASGAAQAERGGGGGGGVGQ
ncbi:hypothetical protein EDC01DRAFT_762369 [Geopyxis carbonaria]|nr:hypothetical protein EDC01DRAFT_762369 [Geopyxis carbonaria]